MGKPEQIKGNIRWYLMDSQGDMVVRVRPGMPLGETPTGDLSFDPSHALLELRATDDGGMILHALKSNDLIAPEDEPPSKDTQPLYGRCEIRLPHHVLHLDTDFAESESESAPLDFRALELPDPQRDQQPELPKPGSPDKQVAGVTPLNRTTTAGTPRSKPAQVQPIKDQRIPKRTPSPEAQRNRKPAELHAADHDSSLSTVLRAQNNRKAASSKTRASRPERDRSADRQGLPEQAKAAILILGAACIVLFFMVWNRDWTPATQVAVVDLPAQEMADDQPLLETAEREPVTSFQAAEPEAGVPATVLDDPPRAGVETTAVELEPTPVALEQTDRPATSSPQSRPESEAPASRQPTLATRNEPTPVPPSSRIGESDNLQREPVIATELIAEETTAGSREIAAEDPPLPSTRSSRPEPATPDIAEVLAAADLALAQGRLTTPAEDSAFGYYSRVLEIDPDSQAAAAGIRKIQQNYINQALAMLAQNALLEADSALASAKLTGANSGLVADLQAEVEFKQQLAAAQNGQFDRIIPVDQLVAIERDNPRWPRNADGSVSALFTVTQTGEVTDVEFINNPPRNLERAALRAIRDWRFEPYLLNGRPLPVRSSVNFSPGN